MASGIVIMGKTEEGREKKKEIQAVASELARQVRWEGGNER